jgi:hypothetical protein
VARYDWPRKPPRPGDKHMKTELQYLKLVGVLLGCALALTGNGQSIYVDVDDTFGPPVGGGGPPSSLFPGAAGVAGHWNSKNLGFQGPLSLSDISGAPISATLYMSGWGGGGSWNNPNISGDFKLLMADAERVSSAGLVYTFQGLNSGWYRVYTLALNPSGQFTSTTIRVPGSISGDQTISGTLSSNTFEHLRTHSIHEILVTNGLTDNRSQGNHIKRLRERISVSGCAGAWHRYLNFAWPWLTSE